MRQRSIRLFVLAMATTAALLGSTGTAHASTPQRACLTGRYFAGAKYAACEQKALAGALFGGDISGFQPRLGKCRLKYAAAWAKLQRKATGTGVLCDNSRYDTSVAGTVTDRLTGLQWEQKTNDATIHDKDNTYAWSATGSDADGTAHTSFLATLNSGPCFAGQCDWRLPTRAELETILSEGYPCTTSPCIDQVAFGPTPTPSYYLTSTSLVGSPTSAWNVFFADGGVFGHDKIFDWNARAVRGGL